MLPTRGFAPGRAGSVAFENNLRPHCLVSYNLYFHSGPAQSPGRWLLWQWTLETSMAIVFNSTLSIEINCRFKPTMDKRAE